MEKVASHINEMQKIYEDYGAVFDQLVAEQIGHNKEVKTPLGLLPSTRTRATFEDAARGGNLFRLCCLCRFQRLASGS